ncbi:MAG: hypothetical protein IBJ16_04525 [Chitinophagaceae bacterium]|nr:hypothetical protein [Chitinophagaceae bacterium]
MKLRSVTLLLLLSAAYISCDKSSHDLKDACFEVKILNEICGNAVVQILDQKLYQYGEKGYKLNGITYDHVFTTTFSCTDMSKLYASSSSLEGLKIKVKATEKHDDDPYCIKCAATIANAPQKFVLLKVVTDCK